VGLLGRSIEDPGRPGTSPEPRLALLHLDARADAGELAARVRRATVVVAATGYRPRLPPVTADGFPVPLRGASGGPSVDDACRIVTARGAPLPRVFSLGLASGFVPSGEMGGEPSFRGHTNGVWLYQHHIGRRVHRGIREVLESRGSR
jgi:hypothetical protein